MIIPTRATVVLEFADASTADGYTAEWTRRGYPVKRVSPTTIEAKPGWGADPDQSNLVVLPLELPLFWRLP